MRCCQPLPVFAGTAGKPGVPRDLSPAKSAGADDGVRAGRGTKERPHLRCVPETDVWCVPEGPRRRAFTSVTGRGSREGPRQLSDRGPGLSSSGRSDGSLAVHLVIASAGICGTDVNFAAGGVRGYTYGHEFAGTTADGQC
jgi:hypothetical protein